MALSLLMRTTLGRSVMETKFLLGPSHMIDKTLKVKSSLNRLEMRFSVHILKVKI